MFKHFLNLLTGNARKPFEKLIDRGTIFEVFKERLDGNARAFECPDTADLPGISFHGIAF